jgi:hypothetical protein
LFSLFVRLFVCLLVCLCWQDAMTLAVSIASLVLFGGCLFYVLFAAVEANETERNQRSILGTSFCVRRAYFSEASLFRWETKRLRFSSVHFPGRLRFRISHQASQCAIAHAHNAIQHASFSHHAAAARQRRTAAVVGAAAANAAPPLLTAASVGVLDLDAASPAASAAIADVAALSGMQHSSAAASLGVLNTVPVLTLTASPSAAAVADAEESLRVLQQCRLQGKMHMMMASHKLLEDLLFLLQSSGVSNRLVGAEVDNNFVRKLIFLLITAFLTQIMIKLGGLA